MERTGVILALLAGQAAQQPEPGRHHHGEGRDEIGSRAAHAFRLRLSQSMLIRFMRGHGRLPAKNSGNTRLRPTPRDSKRN